MLGENAIIENRKEVVGVLERRQAEIIDLAALDLVAELLAAEQVVLGAAHGVVDGRPARHHEGPVARLGEEELAQGLRERTAGALVGARIAPAEGMQPVGAGVQVPVDPVVLPELVA